MLRFELASITGSAFLLSGSLGCHSEQSEESDENSQECFDPSTLLRTGRLSMNGKITNEFKQSSVRPEALEG